MPLMLVRIPYLREVSIVKRESDCFHKLDAVISKVSIVSRKSINMNKRVHRFHSVSKEIYIIFVGCFHDPKLPTDEIDEA